MALGRYYLHSKRKLPRNLKRALGSSKTISRSQFGQTVESPFKEKTLRKRLKGAYRQARRSFLRSSRKKEH